jgi:hypothetical protein
MTSTIATLATEVENRLNMTRAGAEPTVAMLSDFLRLSFKDVIGVLHPIQHTTLTLGNAYSAALVHDKLYAVHASGVPLFTWEYSKSGDNVTVLSTAADRGETIQVWYYVAPTITTGSTTTVDTSCIFGDDWLEELAVIKASMEACLRQSALSASNSPTDYTVLYRTLGEQYDRVFAAHMTQFQMQKQDFQDERGQRRDNGPDPVRYSGHVGFRNNSRKTNWATGAGDEGVPN